MSDVLVVACIGNPCKLKAARLPSDSIRTCASIARHDGKWTDEVIAGRHGVGIHSDRGAELNGRARVVLPLAALQRHEELAAIRLALVRRDHRGDPHLRGTRDAWPHDIAVKYYIRMRCPLPLFTTGILTASLPFAARPVGRAAVSEHAHAGVRRTGALNVVPAPGRDAGLAACARYPSVGILPCMLLMQLLYGTRACGRW